MNILYSSSSRSILALVLTLMVSLTTRAEVHYEMTELWGFVFELHLDDENYENNEAWLMARSPEQPLSDMFYVAGDSTLYIPSSVDDYEHNYYSIPVTNIMSCAFGGCEELRTVFVPASIKTIEERAFTNSSIVSIYFDSNYYEEYTEPIVIHQEAFKGCQRLQAVQFSRPIEEFSPYLFMNCPNLIQIDMNCDLQLRTIGTCAFANCVNLTWLPLQAGIEVIGRGAFANCHNLKQINWKSGLTRIEDYAFAECHQLINVSIPSTVNYIGSHAFLNCHSMTYATIPSGVDNIGDYAFCCCTSLSNLRLNNNIKSIGEFAFAGCNSLPGIDLPAALTTIGEDAFLGGDMHCQIWSPENFYDSTSLDICVRQYSWGVMNGLFDHINIGSNVTSIGDQAFAGHAPDTVVCMAPMPPAFTKTDQYERTFSLDTYANAVLRVPSVLVDTYRNTAGWNRFVNIQGIEIMGNGDADGDGVLSVTDLTTVVDYIVGGQASGINLINCDTDGDGIVSVSDITNIIDAILLAAMN